MFQKKKSNEITALSDAYIKTLRALAAVATVIGLITIFFPVRAGPFILFADLVAAVTALVIAHHIAKTGKASLVLRWSITIVVFIVFAGSVIVNGIYPLTGLPVVLAVTYLFLPKFQARIMTGIIFLVAGFPLLLDDALDFNLWVRIVLFAGLAGTILEIASDGMITLINNLSIADQQNLKLINQLQKANKKAEAAAEEANLSNRTKSIFLANMSHEIRTPLNAIIGYSYLLSHEDLNSEQHETVQRIDISGRNLLLLVNDILDITAIESGELKINKYKFVVNEILDNITAMFLPLIESKNIIFEVQTLPGDMPKILIGDGGRISQLIGNLVGNAMKFTEEGGITVFTDFERVNDHTLILRFTVRDTGIGISQEDMANLFAPFSQIDSSSERKYGGSGLGLSIVKQISEQMGGRAGCRSIEGSGSDFWFEVPVEIAENNSSEIGTGELSASKNLRLILVEEDQARAKSIKSIASNFGWSLDVLSNLDELSDYERVSAEDVDIFVIGAEPHDKSVVMAIENLSNMLGDNLPPILLTKTSGENDFDHLLKNRAVIACLDSPITSSKIYNKFIEMFVGQGYTTTYLSSLLRVLANDVLWLDQVNIMIVDDNIFNLTVCRKILEKEGANITTYENGKLVVETFQKSKKFAYDCILMDIEMPEMDGVQATKLLRQLNIDIPIIALTAGAISEERNRALNAGMSGFLTKPIKPEILIRKTREAVENYRQQPIKVRERDQLGG